MKMNKGKKKRIGKEELAGTHGAASVELKDKPRAGRSQHSVACPLHISGEPTRAS